MNSALFQRYVAPGNAFCKTTVNKRYPQPRPLVLEAKLLSFHPIVDRDRTVSHALNPAHVHFNW